MSVDYDLILPIGERCHSALALKNNGHYLQPNIFDWLGGVSLEVVREAIDNDFRDFLLEKNLMRNEECENDPSYYFVYDVSTGVRVAHLLKRQIEFDKSFKKHYPTLKWLMKKTVQRIRQSNRILMIHCTNQFDYEIKEFVDFSGSIRKLLPDKKVDFLFFTYNNVGCSRDVYSDDDICVVDIPILNDMNQFDANQLFNIPELSKRYYKWMKTREATYKGILPKLKC